jgi:Domain of unknown function (DUF4360)
MSKAVGVLGTALLATLATSSLTTPAQAAPAEGTAPPNVTIEVMDVHGTGCSEDDVVLGVSPDRTVVTIMFSKMVVHAPNPIRDTLRDCSINFQLNFPPGFTYAVVSSDYRGYAEVDEGASASHEARFHFQGETATTVASKTFAGPVADNFGYRQIVDKAVYAPCDDDVPLNSYTRISATAGPNGEKADLSLDSIDTQAETRLNLNWSTCK